MTKWPVYRFADKGRAGWLRLILIGLLCLIGPHAKAGGQAVQVDYTKIDFERDCRKIDGASVESGGVFRCRGYGDYPVYVKIDDLRESVFFGKLNKAFIAQAWESFSPFNSASLTIEWRLRAGKPFAAIHRAFIDNVDPQTGETGAAYRGQVLIVSQVASEENGGESCALATVDARANHAANQMAAEFADRYAEQATCSSERVLSLGKVGATFAPLDRFYPLSPPQ